MYFASVSFSSESIDLPKEEASFPRPHLGPDLETAEKVDLLQKSPHLPHSFET